MAKAKSIAVHNPCPANRDNISRKTDTYHCDSTVKAIVEKGFIDFEAKEDIVIQARCNLLGPIAVSRKVSDIRGFQFCQT